MLLPNQWSLRPAGRQVTLGDFPVNIAVHPDGHYAAVLHSGYGQHEIITVDLDAATVVSRTKLNEAYYGLEFSHGGNRLYCSGASDEVVHVFDFKDGNLKEIQPIRICKVKERGIPCGMAVSVNARDLYVANVWGQCVSKVDLDKRTNVLDITPLPFAETLTIQRKTEMEPEVPVSEDVQAITKRAEAVLDPVNPNAPFPYACRLDDRHHVLYVSLWGRAEVAVVDLNSNKVSALWPTQEHPNEMALTRSGRYLFVPANANRNTVTVLDTMKGKTIETLYASFSPRELPGSAPESLALSPDENTLYVANACNNNVAVFGCSLHRAGKSRSIGFIPVVMVSNFRACERRMENICWWPMAKRRHFNGPTRMAPCPEKRKRADTPQYILAAYFPGSLSIIDLSSGKAHIAS